MSVFNRLVKLRAINSWFYLEIELQTVRSRHSVRIKNLVIELPICWREPKIDLAEPARLRWIEKWTREDLAKRFQRTEVGIQYYFQKFRRADFRITGLSKADRNRIREITSH
ncbi:MAG: hypothetical protein J0L82_18705 [Deltaproteobacteria bacterium]|jgi:hypothetical protein|nr:hypothetical protein [Deltaproteobacteria bacterium]